MKNLAKPLFDIRYFQGINNHDDAEKVLPRGGKSFLTAGVNIDLDNVGMIHRREGYAAPDFSASGVHSLWSNGATCLFVENPDLKILGVDFSATVIRAGVGQSRMVYADAAGRAYYTNEMVIGYVENRVGYLFQEPTMTYRIIMPSGHLIEWFNGRLYVARQNQIWASDPMFPGQTHELEGFKAFAGRLTMMRGIKETGLVISDGFGVYLLSGLDFKDFTVNKLADFPAIQGTDVKIDGSKVGKGFAGEMVMWLSPKGICAAGKGGFFQAFTLDYYHPVSTNEGSAIVREAKGHYQYLVTQGMDPESVNLAAPGFEGDCLIEAQIP
jgi:hypothetical protein